MPHPDFSYEVELGRDDRWTVEGIRPSQGEAEAFARDLVKATAGFGARVLERRKGYFKPRVVLEVPPNENAKPVALQPLRKAPQLCETVDDLFSAEARLALGRVFRAFLDEQGLSALELLFSAVGLTAVERNDRLLTSACQHVGALQAKALGKDVPERVGFFDDAFQTIKAESKGRIGQGPAAAEALKEKGPDAYLAEKGDKEALFALSAVTAEMFESEGKLDRLLPLAERTSGDAGRALLDGAMAELLDGAAGMAAVLGRQRDNLTAWLTLSALQAGQIGNRAEGRLGQLDKLLATGDFPLCRRVILERVTAGVGGVQPLTKQGRADNASGLQKIVRTLANDTGINGGPDLVLACLNRARSTFGDGDGDLPKNIALKKVLGLLAHRPARLGYLLDLIAAGFSSTDILVQALGQLVEGIKGPKDLWPEDMAQDRIRAALIVLRQKAEAISEEGELGALIAGALAAFSGDGAKAPDVAKTLAKAKPVAARTPKAPVKSGPVQKRTVERGTILFEEGEMGKAAYLIVQGTVEISRNGPDGRELIAQLGRGEVFGEMSLIDNMPRMATALALDDTEVILISLEDLEARLDRLEAEDKVLRRLIDTFVNRLRP
ncbi:MAG: cyclic nucleotide-binding domain-containing protein [Magnetovibrionaceae bacterium]